MKLNTNFTDLVCMIQSELADKLDYKRGKMNKYKFISEESFYGTKTSLETL